MVGARAAALLVACWLADAAKKSPKPCPESCTCSRGRGRGDCGVTVTCRRLTHFPATVDYPAKLDCLFIHSPKLGLLNNELKEEGLRAIPNTVRRLDLSESELQELPESGLGHLPELRVLNLEFNKLLGLPEKTFHGLSKLKVLWLTGNHYVPGEPEYRRMKNAANLLKELHKDQFKGLESLQVLLLHHNKLKKLPAGIFSDLRKLRVLKLLDNPFRPPLTRKHAAFRGLFDGDADSIVLRQLDFSTDGGDSLEDMWEKTHTYLSDEFESGPLPPSSHPWRDHMEL